jgi:hypothetical protein
MITPQLVAEQLGLGQGDFARLGQLEAAPQPGQPFELPPPDQAADLLAQLQVAPEDIAPIIESMPSPQANPAEWWLLDEQLAEYLPADSNIVRFQRRFTLVAGESWPADDEIVQFVFGRPRPASLDSLRQRTTLERAIVQHLREGRHWYGRLGWTYL